MSSWSSASGLDLARLGTTATAEEITDTAITQPLVVAATLLAHEELTKRGLLTDAEAVVAGHSVGEIAAYAIAGVISADDAVALAATRGAEMAKACAVEPTGMAAVLGGDEAEVLSRLEDLDLVPANRNAAGQIVAAGARPRWTSWPRFRRQGAGPSTGHRRRVSHPFHGVGPGRLRQRGAGCRHLRAHRQAAEQCRGQPWPRQRRHGQAGLQLTRPVRWDLCTETLRAHNVTASSSSRPRTLAGIAKRELRGVPTHAVKSPADLDGLSEL